MHSILVLNLGTTSFKCKLYSMGDEETILASAGVENIGYDGSWNAKANGEKHSGPCACQTHMEAMELCMTQFRSLGVSIDMNSLDAVGYKAVHGGRISGSHVVDDELLAEMERMVPFAPAHNPVYLSMMRSMREAYPSLLQIACFETAFHATIPQERTVYGVPYEWVEKYGVRRYGFHGSSHSYIAWKMQQCAPHARRVISAHLGGSSSLCAIRDGQSIAVTMGATPQSGLFQNNRVGDFDCFCLPELSRALGGEEAAYKQLSSRSGLLGLSGVSNDMRKVHEAAQAGNAQAQLALDAFADNIAGYVGMFTAYLGRLDALCFTGGIGLNDDALRRAVAERLSFLNVQLDASRNISGFEGCISTAGSGVEIWSLETNEELMVARGCLRLLNA